jgi:hypothetical protein
MATPSGQISLNDVNVELGLAGTTTISMNQTNVRTLAGVPSGAISMQNLQNKSNRVTASATISTDTAGYVLNTAKATGYSAGKTDMTLTIAPSVNVYAASTGSYALTVDTSWAVGDTVTIVNNGVIVGRGGAGTTGSVSYGGYNRATPGGAGGPALLVQRAITMNNLNRIAGGGGGGGGGNWGLIPLGKGTKDTGGGGGGGGLSFGTAGNGGRSNDNTANGSPGAAGTVNTAGGGGGGGGNNGPSNNGGSGGGYGSSGSGGGAGQMPGAGPSGGSAGACIVGNSNITYINTGTRNGSIS